MTDFTLDLTSDMCPMTFVKAKMLVEQMKKGQRADIYVRIGEALDNLPTSLSRTSVSIITIAKTFDNNLYDSEGVFSISIEKI